MIMSQSLVNLASDSFNQIATWLGFKPAPLVVKTAPSRTAPSTAQQPQAAGRQLAVGLRDAFNGSD
jgi:hypothetical protein